MFDVPTICLIPPPWKKKDYFHEFKHFYLTEVNLDKLEMMDESRLFGYRV